MGRGAAGVRGIHLRAGEAVVEMELLADPEKALLLTVMENGLGKMSSVSEYRSQSRGGTGIKVANVTEKTGKVAGARVVSSGDKSDLLLVTKAGQTIRTPLDKVKVAGRSTQGVILMRPTSGDLVASVSLIEGAEGEEKETVVENTPAPTPTPPAPAQTSVKFQKKEIKSAKKK
jgi:DNA gyrase subunit A